MKYPIMDIPYHILGAFFVVAAFIASVTLLNGWKNNLYGTGASGYSTEVGALGVILMILTIIGTICLFFAHITTVK